MGVLAPPSIWEEKGSIFLKTNEARHSAENISFSEFVITLCRILTE
jgi:hypothetical protein